MIPYTLGDKSFFKGQYFSVLVLIKNLSFYDSLEMKIEDKNLRHNFFLTVFFLICQICFQSKKICQIFVFNFPFPYYHKSLSFYLEPKRSNIDL